MSSWYHANNILLMSLHHVTGQIELILACHIIINVNCLVNNIEERKKETKTMSISLTVSELMQKRTADQ